MIDLYKNQYDRKTLKKYIYALHLLDILKTQKIDATFAVRYILNKNYQFTLEEELITNKEVLKYQPHISEINLIQAKFFYRSDDDSVDGFDEI